MSFLVDPPILYASGRISAQLGRRSGPLVAAVIVATALGVGVACYLEQPRARPLWRAFDWRSGREFMWAFPVARAEPPRQAWADALAGLIFASYPGWVALGYARGRR